MWLPGVRCDECGYVGRLSFRQSSVTVQWVDGPTIWWRYPVYCINCKSIATVYLCDGPDRAESESDDE